MSDAAKKEFAPEIKELGDKIVGMSLLQAKALADYLKEVHGIEAAASVAVAGPGPGPGAAAPKEVEKTAFDVMLIKVPDQTKKIAVIKVVRELTGLGLKEAKDLVDKAPQPIKKGAPSDDAEQMKTKLEQEGAVVELK